jgi:hypothetical protein
MVVTSSQLTKIKRKLLHIDFCGPRDNIMNHFYHGLAGGIKPTFVGAILHLQKLEKPFQSVQNLSWDDFI